MKKWNWENCHNCQPSDTNGALGFLKGEAENHILRIETTSCWRKKGTCTSGKKSEELLQGPPKTKGKWRRDVPNTSTAENHISAQGASPRTPRGFQVQAWERQRPYLSCGPLYCTHMAVVGITGASWHEPLLHPTQSQAQSRRTLYTDVSFRP